MKNIDRFSKKTIIRMKKYVYILTYIDEMQIENIFYVGKGMGNRVFDHFANLKDNNIKKRNIIKKYECHAYIVKDQLTNKESLKIESLLINLLNMFGSKQLTNLIKGHDNFEIKTLETINLEYSDPIILENFCQKNKIKILVLKLGTESYMSSRNKDFRGALEGIWRLNSNKVKDINYIIGVYNQNVFGIYRYVKESLKSVQDFNQESWERWNQIHWSMGRPESMTLGLDKNINPVNKMKKVFKLLPIISLRSQKILQNYNVNEIDYTIAKKLINKTIIDKKIKGQIGTYYFGMDDKKLLK